MLLGYPNVAERCCMVEFADSLAKSDENWPGNERSGIGRALVLQSRPCIAIPQICGSSGRRFHQGQERIHIAGTVADHTRNFTGENFWARGYFASTDGRDEEVIRNYIRHQEHEDRRVDQLKLLG